VVRYENKYYVFVSKGNNTFEMKQVQTGQAEHGFLALQNAVDLKENPIAIKGAYNLLMAFKNTGDE
jgi:cobalt-zinc-cadmium efflux system membrane fusion protein